jgi:hypothetical protein
MKNIYKIAAFFRAWFLFLLTPIPFFRADNAGKIHVNWNTWLLSGSKSVQGMYSQSIKHMMLLWFVLLTTLITISFFAPVGVTVAWVVVVVSCTTPLIMRSYEAWNIAEAMSLVSGLVKNGVKDPAKVRSAVKDFLKKKATKTTGSFNLNNHNVEGIDPYLRFDHLEYFMRRYDLWKGNRAELFSKTKQGPIT